MAYSVSYVPQNPRLGLQPISVTDTTQQVPLGTRVDRKSVV